MDVIGYRNLHFRSSIIQRAVWLYARFNLSLRNLEELMAERGVDQNSEVLEVLVQAKRDKRAALKLLKKHDFAPQTIVTDKGRAYAAAFRDLGLNARHHQSKWKNNRIEGSHVRVRR